MTYKIEKDIPVPAGTGGPSPERQALDQLQPNESILFPADTAKTALNAATNKAAKSRTWTFTTQKQPDGSRRIWRLT